MTKERFEELMSNDDLGLTEEEKAEGWHFCNEFDGLLVRGNPKKNICDSDCWGLEPRVFEQKNLETKGEGLF